MCLDDAICGSTDSVVVEMFDEAVKSILWSNYFYHRSTNYMITDVHGLRFDPEQPVITLLVGFGADSYPMIVRLDSNLGFIGASHYSEDIYFQKSAFDHNNFLVNI